MTDQSAASRDPLAPIDFAVTVVTALFLLGLTALVIAISFGSGSGLGFGGDEVCAQTRPGVVPWGGSRAGGDHVIGLAADARAYPTDLAVCATDPGVRDRIAYGLTRWPSLLLALGFLLGLRMLIRTARRDGMFTATVAHRAGMLGWFLLAGAVVAATIEAGANGWLLQSLVTDVGSNAFLALWSVSWATLFGAVGLITIGRVLGQTVAMREELDATV